MCAGAVEIGLDFVSLSNAGLAAEEAPALAEQLGKFPGLRRLDVSANPCLDHAAVSLIINSLSSNAHPLHQSSCVVFSFSMVLSHSYCAAGAVNFVQLNLSGIGAESLPDDIGHNLPRLRILILDNCDKLKFLPLQLGMIKGLESVSVKGCTALLYPPKSQRVDSKKMANFLKTLHKNSVIWRRLKVGAAFQPCHMSRWSHIQYRLFFSATGAVVRRLCCALLPRSRCSLTSSRLEAS